MQENEVEELEQKLEESKESKARLKLELSYCQDQQRQLQHQVQEQLIQMKQLQLANVQLKRQQENTRLTLNTGDASLQSSLTNNTSDCEHAIKSISVIGNGTVNGMDDIP